MLLRLATILPTYTGNYLLQLGSLYRAGKTESDKCGPLPLRYLPNRIVTVHDNSITGVVVVVVVVDFILYLNCIVTHIPLYRSKQSKSKCRNLKNLWRSCFNFATLK